jgi:hypothetical protein
VFVSGSEQVADEGVSVLVHTSGIQTRRAIPAGPTRHQRLTSIHVVDSLAFGTAYGQDFANVDSR